MSNNHYLEDRDDLYCSYCKKKCKNINSLKQHEIRCRVNPNRIPIKSPFSNPEFSRHQNSGRSPWNKGLTKETDDRVMRMSESMRKSSHDYIKLNGHSWSTGRGSTYEIEANRKCKISKSMRLSTNCGGLRTRSGRGKKGWYKGYFCDSTYELAYVIYNIDHGVSFKRCIRYYEYEYNGEICKYYPDFELEDGTIVEISGYMTGRKYAKLKSVKDRKIVNLTESDLKEIFEYVRSSYSYNRLEELYENCND